MKIDLIGMILNNAGRRCFDGAIIDDDGKELDAAHSLDYMIMEYAKVRNGGESSTVVVSRYVTPNAALSSGGATEQPQSDGLSPPSA